MREPAAGLTTWFYAAAADGSFPAIDYRVGRRIVASGAMNRSPRIPVAWLDANAGLTLIGIGLVLQVARPVYIDRCSISFHATPRTRKLVTVPEDLVDYEGLALRLRLDSGAPARSRHVLASFLRASRAAVLLEDMFVYMQVNRADLEPVWLEHLRRGRQTHAMFDLRSGRLHPPNTPLHLADTTGWRKDRRHDTRAGRRQAPPA